MAIMTTSAMNFLRQQERFTNLPPLDVLWQRTTPYDELLEREMIRLKLEDYYSQGLTRAPTNIQAVLAGNRHNKKLLLCQP